MRSVSVADGPKRALLCLGAAGVVVAVCLALPASGPASISRCAVRGSTTLRENGQVRVYRVPEHGKQRDFEVFACSKASGEGTPLGAIAAGDYPFLGPVIDLNGPVIGYATQECDREFCGTSIAATDMRHPNDVHGFLNGSYGAPRPHLVKVGSLQVARGGKLMWISCPQTRRSEVDGLSEPSCVRAGHRDTVWLRAKGEPFQRLDRGRTIDPSSLRLEHGRISWIHGRHRRHASLLGQ